MYVNVVLQIHSLIDVHYVLGPMCSLTDAALPSSSTF